jgi:hypothetical protein
VTSGNTASQQRPLSHNLQPQDGEADEPDRDTEKFNKQYPAIEIKEFNNSHDRFLIIDNKAVYHFGASLKDLGKKWFAFSKMDIGTGEMLRKLHGIHHTPFLTIKEFI